MARVITAPDVDEDELQLIYNWVDEIYERLTVNQVNQPSRSGMSALKKR